MTPNAHDFCSPVNDACQVVAECIGHWPDVPQLIARALCVTHRKLIMCHNNNKCAPSYYCSLNRWTCTPTSIVFSAHQPGNRNYCSSCYVHFQNDYWLTHHFSTISNWIVSISQSRITFAIRCEKLPVSCVYTVPFNWWCECVSVFVGVNDQRTAPMARHST